MHCVRRLIFLAVIASTLNLLSQSVPESRYYSRTNSFGFLAEYSNNSSHILLGSAEQRKLLSFGVDYSRRLFMGRIVKWQYVAELTPVMFESDPVVKVTRTITSPPPVTSSSSEAVPLRACQPSSGNFSGVLDGVTYATSFVATCSRRWTFAEGFSPIGSQFNFLPTHRIQPVFSFLGGYMFSTKPIPIETAGSWNFTFEVGAGFEIYRSGDKSIRAEYVLHHISNAYTANENPGIDSGLLKVVYSFGR